MVEETATGFLESVCGAIRFVDNEVAVMCTVEGDPIFVLDL